jgi:hypothetical protein
LLSPLFSLFKIKCYNSLIKSEAERKIKKLIRILTVILLAFGFNLWLPINANATCVNYIQSQAIAAAYSGDEIPTVHEMDTCGGDDVSYQIPIATTITFDGVQYDQVYATTNSVITFGRPDGTYWDYPQTPSISLYSMDWVSGWYNAPDTLNISYSEGGFQLGLQVIPFGQWGAPVPSNINILVAITNTGGISVAYSYQGPEYPNLRTGVRLHDGSIVSLEAWGATQIQAGSPTPTLSAEPVPEPSPSPTGPSQAEIAFQEEARITASLIANAIASAQNVTPEPSPEQTQPVDPTPTPTPETTSEPEPTPSPEPSPTVEPSPEPSPQPTDIDPSPEPTPAPSPTAPSPEPSSDTTTEPEIVVVEPEVITPEDPRFPEEPTVSGETNDLIRQLSDLTSKDTLAKLTPEQKAAVAVTLGIKPDEINKVAELAKTNEAVAEALTTFSEKAKANENAPMPYTLADAVTEVQAEKLLADPIGALTNINLEKVLSPSEWGKDMTDDQRKKVQEIVIPVIIASNLVASSMTRRK